MAVDPSVVINIAAEYTGKAAFKQADTATQKLSKGVGKLAKNLGLAFGTTAILAYGKASIKAAAADEKAQQQLALALKNVGLGRDAASSEAYIQDLQSEFGIVDDKLRPAYQTLAVATRSSAKAQQLLNLALDISASTGKDLGSVTAALSKAFLGNNTSLSKLGVGISKADLKAGKFEDIIAKLTTTFAGSATAAANTFQGSIDKLGVASANVQEIIGTGLIDALKNLGDSNSVDDLATSMQNTALYTADVIRGLGTLLTQLKSLPGVSKIDIGMIPIVGSYLEFFKSKGQTSRLGGGGGFPQGAPKEFQSGIDARSAAAALAADAKARKAAALAAAKLAASQKATVKSQADALKLAKAKAVFDLQKIQIEAALKTKLSEEDKIRLNLMKAIEEENIENADKYQKALEKSQEKTKGLADLLATVMAMQIADPFGQWSIDPLTASINALTTSIGGVGTAITASGKEWSSFTGKVAETVIQPNLQEFSSSFTNAINAIVASTETASTGISTLSTTAATTAAANATAAAAATTAALTSTSSSFTNAIDGITASFATAVTGLNTLTTSASKTASDAAAAATATANAALTSTSATATDAIGSSTTSATDATNTAIASSTVATAVTIVDTSQSAADALDLLYSNATTALTDASAATVTDFMATSSAALADLQAILAAQGAAYVAAVQAASAQAAADAADLAGAGNTKVEITVNAGVIADADQIAEVVQGAIQTITKNGNPLFVAGDE